MTTTSPHKANNTEPFDIAEFARMFDAALASDNPAVQKALRNFMMIAAIVHAEETDKRVRGPFETLIKRVDTLESMVMELQKKIGYNNQKDQYYKDYYSTNPTWVYQPYTTSVSTTSGTTSGTSIKKVWADEYDTIKDYLKDLKFNDKS